MEETFKERQLDIKSYIPPGREVELPATPIRVNLQRAHPDLKANLAGMRFPLDDGAVGKLLGNDSYADTTVLSEAGLLSLELLALGFTSNLKPSGHGLATHHHCPSPELSPSVVTTRPPPSSASE